MSAADGSDTMGAVLPLWPNGPLVGGPAYFISQEAWDMVCSSYPTMLEDLVCLCVCVYVSLVCGMTRAAGDFRHILTLISIRNLKVPAPPILSQGKGKV